MRHGAVEPPQQSTREVPLSLQRGPRLIFQQTVSTEAQQVGQLRQGATRDVEKATELPRAAPRGALGDVVGTESAARRTWLVMPNRSERGQWSVAR